MITRNRFSKICPVTMCLQKLLPYGDGNYSSRLDKCIESIIINSACVLQGARSNQQSNRRVVFVGQVGQELFVWVYAHTQQKPFICYRTRNTLDENKKVFIFSSYVRPFIFRNISIRDLQPIRRGLILFLNLLKYVLIYFV